MPKKLTIKFVREQFEKENYTLVSDVYVNSKTPLEYICPESDKGMITWNGWQQGHRCDECGGTKKLTIMFIRKEFEKEGYTLLSKEYVNSRQGLEYICPELHTGFIGWDSWQQGHRCDECGGTKKLTIMFIRKEFEKEGYTLLSKEYVNAHEPLKYVCPEGDHGTVVWNGWQQGQRCSKCYGNRKLTTGFVKKEFEKEGYILLTEKYINARQELEYICPKEHKGGIVWGDWQQGIRCAECKKLNMLGKNNPNYNPNLTDMDREKSRKYLEYTEWAKQVKIRDNFICQLCGDNKGGNLVSHHIESYNSNKELRTLLVNGVCLCENCHKNFHHQYGYGNNTKEQFNYFINNYNKQRVAN